MADSSAIDNALMAMLGSDAALLALCPNGVYYDEAPAGMTRFVIVSLVVSFDEPMFGARAFEDGVYLVKAVMLSTAGGNIAAAAARIDALLDPQAIESPPVSPLTVAGYAITSVRRVERVRSTEVDDIDRTIRWFHRGGRYQVMASNA